MTGFNDTVDQSVCFTMQYSAYCKHTIISQIIINFSVCEEPTQALGKNANSVSLQLPPAVRRHAC